LIKTWDAAWPAIGNVAELVGVTPPDTVRQ